MEALGVAASIIAVTTIALQSAKAVYTTVNGIKNGPKEVKDLASALTDLSYILEQVAEISNLFGDTDRIDLSGLKKVMDECVRTLADFRKQLEKLDVLSDEGSLEKARRRVKLAVQKEDFRRMWVTVRHYISVFGTHLSVIGRRRDHIHHNDFARHMLQTETDSKVLKQNNEILKQVENGLRGLGGGLSRQENQTKLDIRDIKAGYQAAECLGERLNDLAGMSTGQNETMMEKLAQIQNQVEKLTASNVLCQKMFTPEVPYSDNSQNEEAENRTDDSDAGIELSESIDRLCGLAKKPKTTVFSDEAQQIITDLENILNLVSREAKSPETRKTRKRKQDQLADLEYAEVSKNSKQDLDLENLQGLLTSSSCIAVNEQASFDTKIASEIRRYRKTTFQNHVTDIGAISVHVKRRRLLKNAGQDEKNISTTNHDEEIEEILEGRVNFMPKKTGCRTKISTSFLQKFTQDGFFALRPRLSFCAILPDNSKIFAFVRNGDLKGVIDHLQQGKASLSDCDSEGRSLLNYALYHARVEICEFLINKGADVDAVEPRLCLDTDKAPDKDLFACSAESHLNGHHEKFDGCGFTFWEKKQASVLDCRRLLLNAGADPIPRGSLGRLFDYLSGSNTSGSKESLALVLNLGGEFIDDYESKDEQGRTILLMAARGYGYGIDSHCIQLVLDRGASIMARDNQGQTCLHLAVANIRSPGNVSDRNSLLLMVKAGADVYAMDNEGTSVSGVAYTITFRDERYNRGTYRGDLWDEVLTECGYDAAWFREDYRRRHPIAVHGLVQELGEVSDIEERESMIEEQGSEIDERESMILGQGSEFDGQESEIEELGSEFDGYDSDKSEETGDIIMEDANVQCRSPSSPEEGLRLPGIEEIWGENVWCQTDPIPEASGNGTLQSTEGQHISPRIDGLFDFNTEESHSYLQDTSLYPQDASLYPQDASLYPQDASLYPQDAALGLPTFQGNLFFNMEDDMDDQNVWA